MKTLWPRPVIPPVGDPILPRVRHPNADFDWTFGGEYQPIFVDSGTTALRLAIEVAMRDAGRSGTVWVPAYGCPDILAATFAAGATPVLYDTGADRPFFAPGQRSPGNLIACVAAHFLGLAHPADDIRSAAKDTGCLLIEDSAQRFPMPGDTLFGDVVVLSFGRGKPVSLMEGGCLLVKASLYSTAAAIGSTYQRRDSGFMGGAKRHLHDVAIRPSVYGLIRRLPGLAVGEVSFKSAPLPTTIGPHFQRLASRAARAFQADDSWLTRQQWTKSLASLHFTELHGLTQSVGQDARRLLRMPFLAPDDQGARSVCRRAFQLGIEATRMYGSAQTEICGVPGGIRGEWRQASRFSKKLVTLPIPARYIDPV